MKEIGREQMVEKDSIARRWGKETGTHVRYDTQEKMKAEDNDETQYSRNYSSQQFYKNVNDRHNPHSLFILCLFSIHSLFILHSFSLQYRASSVEDHTRHDYCLERVEYFDKLDHLIALEKSQVMEVICSLTRHNLPLSPLVATTNRIVT